MRIVQLFFTLPFLLTITTAAAQEIDNLIKEKLDAKIEQYVEGVSPGMAVGIVKDGQVVYEKYIGYANLEHEVVITEEARFNIASNAKQYTALVVLKLVAEGDLQLDDDIRQWLPQLYENIEDKITIRQLLTHTSGIRDVYDLWALKGKTWWKLFIDNNDAMELINNQTDLNFDPGTSYMYSNSNYILLTQLIEKITEEKFHKVVAKMFNDLDMKNSSFLTNYMSVVPKKARPYGNWNGWIEYPTVTETHGDGALYTTLSDQLKWETIVQSRQHAALNSNIIAQSQKSIPQAATNDYGYGLMFGTYKGKPYAYHDGNTGAYNATFLRFVQENMSMVVLSNNGNIPTNYLSKQLTDIVLGLENTDETAYPSGPKEISELTSFDEVIGMYKTGDGTYIKIVEKEGELYREIYGRDPVKLVRENGSLFHYESNMDLKMAFSTAPDNQQIFTIYLSSQPPNVGTKLSDQTIGDTDRLSICGDYYNDETDTHIKIEYKEEDTFSITKNGRTRTGGLVYKDVLLMNSYEIKVHRAPSGKADGLIVKNGRIDQVRFVRK